MILLTLVPPLVALGSAVAGLRPTAYLAMHIPDGFLSLPISLATWTIAIALIAVCLRKVRVEYQERTVPLMGVCAAFIFAAQMINFPIPGGTSGHLLGGTLAGVLLGPWAGSLVMAVVFVVQAVLFQDGGLTVLGANIVNMGLVGTLGGYYLYQVIRRVLGWNAWRGIGTGTAIAGWMSVFVASMLCALQLAFSGTIALPIALSAMAFWHVMIGVGEAIITVIAVGFIYRTRPELLYKPPQTRPTKVLVHR